MTDTQHFFDLARKQFDSLADDIERHFDQVASHLREWIPYDPHTHTISLSPPRPTPPPTTLQLAQRWAERHKALTAALLAFTLTGGVGTYLYIRHTTRRRKRRARKSPSGARTDVVVVAPGGGAVAHPLASALYLDLERRGFVVYVLAHSAEEERFVRSQNRADLLPLHLDLLDPAAAGEQVRRFEALLGREHRAFEGGEAHRLRFCGLVLVPDVDGAGTAGRIEEVDAEDWSDALNAHVLHTIATTRLFLPAARTHGANVLLLTPSVASALRLPGHGVQSTVAGALEGFFATLAAEVRGTGVGVTQFKLGSIDVPALTARQRREGAPKPRLKATPQRRLHDAVFDALVARRPARTWHVGRGARAYDFAGTWMPAGLVGWLMGGAGGSLGDGRRSDGVEAEMEEGLAGSQGSLTWEKVEQEG